MTMSSPVPSLPDFIPPMLAETSTPFDSDKHLFEIKWDGVRTLCFIENGSVRLVNRRQVDMTHRFPEFAHFGRLTPGMALDGEMIVLKGGKPDFPLLQSRDHAQRPFKIQTLSQKQPATYVAFDVLYDAFTPVMNRPLSARRELLEQRIAEWQPAGMLLSQGVVGRGTTFFQQAVAKDLEGMMAKRLASFYLPGQRTRDWLKIKRGQELLCVVIGFTLSGKKDFRSLILATEVGGQLECSGKVGTGWSDAQRLWINDWLWSHLQPKPVIPCAIKGKWVEPKLVLRVSCMERTANGELRAPVFEELVSS